MTTASGFLADFNSIKVQLELLFPLLLLPGAKFQFHKGTIRTLFEGRDNIEDETFQFHKGTIRTVGAHISGRRPFQFHKGTIRTDKSRRWAVCSSYFNSIKVQLEHGQNQNLIEER